MGIGAEILGLRHKHVSSVAELLAALERVREARVDKISGRVFLAGEAADRVLTNVAAHAAEALSEEPRIGRVRRAAPATRRPKRRYDAGALSRQRILFA